MQDYSDMFKRALAHARAIQEEVDAIQSGPKDGKDSQEPRRLTTVGAELDIPEAVENYCICWDTDGDDAQYRVCPVHPLLS